MAEPKKTKVYTSHKVTQVVATLFVAMPCHATSHTRLVYGDSETGCLPIHPWQGASHRCTAEPGAGDKLPRVLTAHARHESHGSPNAPLRRYTTRADASWR